MALKADSELDPTPQVTTRPVNDTFDFDVDVVDRRADKPRVRTLELTLAPGNDLFFTGRKKTVEQDETVGKDPVHVTFKTKTISGSGAGLSSFRVTLQEKDGPDLVFCLIRLE
jgi:hypothetical protein